jgi:preprotein translocase subunit SecG
MEGNKLPPTYLIIAQILIAVALIVTVLFQLHGGGLGGIFGQADSVYRSRRGIERTLLRLTIVLAVIFVIFAVLIVMSV